MEGGGGRWGAGVTINDIKSAPLARIAGKLLKWSACGSSNARQELHCTFSVQAFCVITPPADNSMPPLLLPPFLPPPSFPVLLSIMWVFGSEGESAAAVVIKTFTFQERLPVSTTITHSGQTE